MGTSELRIIKHDLSNSSGVLQESLALLKTFGSKNSDENYYLIIKEMERHVNKMHDLSQKLLSKVEGVS